MNLVPSVLGKEPIRELDFSHKLPLELGYRRAQNDNTWNRGEKINE